MTPRFDQHLERQHELQIDDALFGLTAAEQAELDRLGATADASAGEDEIALEAAVATLAAALTLRDDVAAQTFEIDSFTDVADEVMPPELVARIRADAAAHVSPAARSSRSFKFPKSRAVSFAAAAMLFLTCGLIGFQVMQSTWFTQKMLIAERNAMMAEYGLAVQYRTLRTMDEAPRGDVVWCDEAQQGYVTIGGLDVSRPGVDQYRIWIILTDETGGEHAVDAGAFRFDDRDCELVIEVRPTEMVVDLDRIEIVSEPVDAESAQASKGTLVARTRSKA